MLSVIKQRIEYAKSFKLNSIEVPEHELTADVKLALYLEGSYDITYEDYEDGVYYTISWD